jgi:hypothetical protein
MSDSKHLRNSQGPGGQFPQRPGRKLELEIKLFANTDQGVPIRIICGHEQAAGVHIFPIFNLKSKKIKVKKGK